MKESEVEICWLIPEKERNLQHPSYETVGAAGMDVQAGIPDSLMIRPGERVLVPTGFSVALQEGYELQVRPRSGLAVKYGLTIINSPGTIDADYRGEVKIAMINLGHKPYTVNRGDRIAQLVLAPVVRATFKEVSSLDKTKRDTGGFGHTGE
ncbi:MAG: dUTP diphosphatase [Desulfobulbaceae bacterium]|nr:dUTP diphosphatase [Desulfobulbaceae bacterium]